MVPSEKMSQPDRKWMTIAPMFQIMFEPCMCLLGPLVGLFVRVRWLIAGVMEIRLVPKVVPVIPLPYIREIFFLTIGDLLLIVPLLLLLFYATNLTFVSPNVIESGRMASYAIYLTVLTATKSNNLVSLIFGIPFGRLIPYHALCSLVAIAMGCGHTYVSYKFGTGSSISSSGGGDSNHADFGSDPDLIQFLADGRVNLTGSILVAALSTTMVISIVPIRRFFFKLWLSSHILLAMTALVACFLHNATTVVFVMLWWALDFFFIRYMLMAGCRYRTMATLEELITGEDDRHIVRLVMRKPDGFEFSAGQFIQIAVPAVSLFQFHPATITSAPHEEDYVIVHFRGLGGWTEALVNLAASGEKEETLVLFEGPYGKVSVDFDNAKRYKTVVLVGGGIGSTHCESIGRTLLHERCETNNDLYLRYIWTVRKFALVQEMPPLGGYNAIPSNTIESLDEHMNALDVTGHTSNGGGGGEPRARRNREPVDIQIFCTREDVEEIIEEPPDDARPYRVTYTRPDYDMILMDVKREVLEADGDETNVAVICCGPTGMMHALQEACRRHSDTVVGCDGSHAVFFDFHMERFQF